MSELRIEPISDFGERAAAVARERIRQFAELARQRILANSEYFTEVAEGLRVQEADRARNLEFFEQNRRRL